MGYQIWKTFTFEASHRLEFVPGEHKCSRLHGHSYQATLTLEGDLEKTDEGDLEDGSWIIDFADVKKVWRENVHNQLDHRHLNDVEDLEYTTVEEVARWIFDAIKPKLPQLVRVDLHETDTAGATYSE